MLGDRGSRTSPLPGPGLVTRRACSIWIPVPSRLASRRMWLYEESICREPGKCSMITSCLRKRRRKAGGVLADRLYAPSVVSVVVSPGHVARAVSRPDNFTCSPEQASHPWDSSVRRGVNNPSSDARAVASQVRRWVSQARMPTAWLSLDGLSSSQKQRRIVDAVPPLSARKADLPIQVLSTGPNEFERQRA